MRNIVLSAEVLERKIQSVSKASEANRVPVIIENIKTHEKWEYASMTEAAEALGVHKNNIGNAIKNNRIIKKTYRARKKD